MNSSVVPLNPDLLCDRADLAAQALHLGQSQLVDLLRRHVADDARANEELVVARAVGVRGQPRLVRCFRPIRFDDERLEASQRRLVIVGDRAASIRRERRALRIGEGRVAARKGREQRTRVDILDNVGVDGRGDAVEHRLRAHPAACQAGLQPLDRVVDEPGHCADALDVVAVIVGLPEWRHLRRAGHQGLQTAERAQNERFRRGELLRLDRELHLVENQLVRDPVLAVKRLCVDGPQPLERAALARVLALELRQRHVGQHVAVPGDPAHRRLDRVPPQRCLEVFVEKGLELGFGCDIPGLCVHADHSEDEESCKTMDRARRASTHRAASLGARVRAEFREDRFHHAPRSSPPIRRCSGIFRGR